MKTLPAFLILIITSISMYAQNSFNCCYFDDYNKDTVVQIRDYHRDENGNFISLDDYELKECTTVRYKVKLSETDIKRQEELLLCCIDWLLSNPEDQNIVKREEIIHFVRNAHSVSVIVNENLLQTLQREIGEEIDIRPYYEMGIIRYITKFTYEPDNIKLQTQGLLALYEFFQSNPRYIEYIPAVFSKYQESLNNEILTSWISEL